MLFCATPQLFRAAPPAFPLHRLNRLSSPALADRPRTHSGACLSDTNRRTALAHSLFDRFTSQDVYFLRRRLRAHRLLLLLFVAFWSARSLDLVSMVLLHQP